MLWNLLPSSGTTFKHIAYAGDEQLNTSNSDINLNENKQTLAQHVSKLRQQKETLCLKLEDLKVLDEKIIYSSEEEDTENEICEAHLVNELACVAWRFCRAGRTNGEAAKFACKARKNVRQSREKNKNGFSSCSRPNLLTVSLLSPALIT